MVGWLLRRTGPQHRLFSVEEVKAFTAGQDVAVVAFLDSEDDGGEAALVVAEWADGQEDFPVAVTSANDVLKHYGAGPGSVVMFNKVRVARWSNQANDPRYCCLHIKPPHCILCSNCHNYGLLVQFFFGKI